MRYHLFLLPISITYHRLSGAVYGGYCISSSSSSCPLHRVYIETLELHSQSSRSFNTHTAKLTFSPVCWSNRESSSMSLTYLLISFLVSSCRASFWSLSPNAFTKAFHGRLETQSLKFGQAAKCRKIPIISVSIPPYSSRPSMKNQNFAGKMLCSTICSNTCMSSLRSHGSEIVESVICHLLGQIDGIKAGHCLSIWYSKVWRRPLCDFCIGNPAFQKKWCAVISFIGPAQVRRACKVRSLL